MASWEAGRRLDYIDFRLMTVGTVNREDLMRTFGVSVAQASKDLNIYAKRYPGMMNYSTTAKRYILVAPLGSTQRGMTTAAIDLIRALAAIDSPLGWR